MRFFVRFVHFFFIGSDGVFFLVGSEGVRDSIAVVKQSVSTAAHQRADRYDHEECYWFYHTSNGCPAHVPLKTV